MDTFFCAEESRQAGEDPIGTADTYKMYVLLECPTPWTETAINSKFIPDNLRILYKEIAQTELSVRLLLIYNERLYQKGSTKCIIYNKSQEVSANYIKHEFEVSHIQDVAPVLKQYFIDGNIHSKIINTQTRDILVCTHGSNDKCCAKYGNPFYRQALATVADLSLTHVRIWQVSHFGGHRFAPTVIDFPEARYYARLDQNSFFSILTQTGNTEYLNQCFKNNYRGWGILPEPAQVLERELILLYGWDWFNYKLINYHLLAQNETGNYHRIEISFVKPNNYLIRVQADVVEDESKVIYLIGECNGTELEKTPQFTVKNIIYV
ncbi:hypothetical protein DSM106972_045610 [Dulcicalothrix desertica PCC 7102]|uniref:Sucrase ferredoxin n=1 Tax=Dulcicalothrix desertica PCC 7102 TaxID=232991 RepID=A0A3S1AM28_9CYAN|nr:sucrase ferredoxin [Dulcicalothrix desertica]RUT04333.1 hypothetical protein DSM106972_045610 [Dulcicalothrix desertica PCC 7102]TWH51187.1 hypothetical protein CAL7102_05570 [Dulcicalothrix desertica PCC 7102]